MREPLLGRRLRPAGPGGAATLRVQAAGCALVRRTMRASSRRRLRLAGPGGDPAGPGRRLRSRAPHDARSHHADASGLPIPAATLRVRAAGCALVRRTTRAFITPAPPACRSSAATLRVQAAGCALVRCTMRALTTPAPAARRRSTPSPAAPLRDGDRRRHALELTLDARTSARPAPAACRPGRRGDPAGPGRRLRSRAPHDARFHHAGASGSPVPGGDPAGWRPPTASMYGLLDDRCLRHAAPSTSPRRYHPSCRSGSGGPHDPHAATCKGPAPAVQELPDQD
jgi:hypothetical protein